MGIPHKSFFVVDDGRSRCPSSFLQRAWTGIRLTATASITPRAIAHTKLSTFLRIGSGTIRQLCQTLPPLLQWFAHPVTPGLRPAPVESRNGVPTHAVSTDTSSHKATLCVAHSKRMQRCLHGDDLLCFLSPQAPYVIPAPKDAQAPARVAKRSPSRVIHSLGTRL